jgi:hypothetical protein
LHDAIMAATSEWVWILDIDDLALPDALDGLDKVDGDVWQMGYQTDDGHGNVSGYEPPQLTAEEYLDQRGNPFTAGSASAQRRSGVAAGSPTSRSRTSRSGGGSHCRAPGSSPPAAATTAT